MPTAIRIAAPIAASFTSSKNTLSRNTSSRNSDRSEFAAVALFSAIGLLVSIVAILSGVQGAWY